MKPPPKSAKTGEKHKKLQAIKIIKIIIKRKKKWQEIKIIKKTRITRIQTSF